jgi:epoxyqueuosine reductase QueG
MKIEPFLSDMDKQKITDIIKEKTIDIGFDACGVAAAKRLSRDEVFLRNWLSKGLHATMQGLKA